jgi:hypothetical protein
VHQSLTQRSFTSCSFERRAQCVQHSDESLGASSSLPIPEWKVIVDHLIRIYHVHAKDSGVVQSLFVMLGNLTNQTSIRKIVFESEALVIGHEILRKRDMENVQIIISVLGLLRNLSVDPDYFLCMLNEYGVWSRLHWKCWKCWKKPK